MRKYILSALVIGLALVLSACGSGGDGDSFRPEPPAAGFSVTVSPDASTIPVHQAENPVYPEDTPFATRVVVSVSRSNGGVPADGQRVTLRATPSSLGMISAPPGTAGGDGEDGSVPPFIPQSSSLSLPLRDGQAEFYLHSRAQAGTVTIEASFTGSNDSGSQTVRGSSTVNVTSQNVDPLEALTFQIQRTTLPKNTTSDFTPFMGSPFTASVIVQQRSLDGRFMPPAARVDEPVQGSIPIEGVAAISILDDPETTDINEFTSLWGSIYAGRGAAGQSQFFVHALDQSGTAEFSVSYLDTVSGRVIGRSVEFTVIDSASNGLPATATLSQDDGGLYVEGSNGRSAKSVNVQVFDGGGERILDPEGPDGSPAVNNVRFEIIDNGGASDARLTANSAHGGSNSGTSVNTFTVNGQANVSVRAGNQTGVVTIQATVDGHDNNVENGITDPITASTEVVISDGELFSLTFTMPWIRAISANPSDAAIVIEDGLPVIERDDDGIPVVMDGTYSLVMSVQANDRLGNPVLPGTNIQFGLVDYPLVEGSYPGTGGGTFALSGSDGNPSEGRRNFSAPDGRFITDSEGQVGPGDSLLLFGRDVPGGRNRDHTSQRFVDSVLSDTSLTVERRFNLNDDSGSMLDSGPVIPYVIGRAVHGTVSGSAQTNERGLAEVRLNYPVSRLNRVAAVWAQGNGRQVQFAGSNFTKSVADVALARYFGIAPLSLTASPNTISANTTSLVSICVSDALSSPYPGLHISFAVSNAQGATVQVDGQTGTGTVASPTGLSGCTLAEVSVSGQIQDSENITITFSAGGASDEVVVVAPGGQVLQVSPSAIRGNNSRDITLRLLDGNGSPVSGVQITGTCEVGGGGLAEILSGPGVTNENGETVARVRTTGMQTCGSPPSGQCIFTTGTGAPQGVLNLEGVDLTGANFSPGGDPCEP